MNLNTNQIVLKLIKFKSRFDIHQTYSYLQKIYVKKISTHNHDQRCMTNQALDMVSWCQHLYIIYFYISIIDFKTNQNWKQDQITGRDEEFLFPRLRRR